MNEDKELVAMTAIAKALDVFNDDDKVTVERILKWAISRYGVPLNLSNSIGVSNTLGSHGVPSHHGDNEFDVIADLYTAVNPKTDPEKALVAGYWMTIGEGKSEFGSQEVNSHLKHLGHGVSNITDSLSALINRKPALVMQTAKSGKSKQARKKYKLTTAGINVVKQMIKSQADSA